MAQGMKRGNRISPWTGVTPIELRRGTPIEDTSPLMDDFDLAEAELRFTIWHTHQPCLIEELDNER